MKKKKKSLKTSTILLIIGIITVAVIAVILIVNGMKGKNGTSVSEQAKDQKLLSEMDQDVIPYGDDDSDSYEFAGDYFDMATKKGTLHIEKDGSTYNANITYTETDDSMAIWTMTCAYDKYKKALVFRDCTRTDYVMEEDSPVATDEKYTDGSGLIYMTGGNLFWVDDKDDMGTGLLFSKTTDLQKEAEEKNKAETSETKTEAGTEETKAEETETEETTTEETETEETTTEETETETGS